MNIKPDTFTQRFPGPVWDTPNEGTPSGGDTAPASLIENGDDTVVGDDTTPGDDTITGDDTVTGNDTIAADEPLTLDAIEIPEGIEVDQETMTDFLGIMNDAELSPQDRAQKLVDLQLAQNAAAEKAGQDGWAAMQNEWQAEARALPEIGGDKLNETLAGIKTGLEKLGATEKTFEALSLTGAGNHPEIISILHKATAHLKEGGPVDAGTPPAGNLSQADRLYGGNET